MNYTSLIFLLFVTLLMCIYYIFPKKFRWSILLVGSIFFYYLLSGKYIIYIVVATLISYIFALLINKHEKQKKKLLITSILLVLSFLLVLKYNNFFISLINPFVGLFDINIAFKKFIMPIGISYYTLDMIAYLSDIYRKKIIPEKNPLKLLLFFTYFPKIIEGPFVRYDSLSKTLFNPNKFNYYNFRNAWVLIGYGFFKKLVIADRAGIFVDNIFKTQTVGLASLFAIVFYTIQIYCDFSGSIQIITGVSELFGVQLPENFKRPFFSKSIQEFWKRWHITLGEWLKDYIFYPISLSKMNMKLNLKVRKMKNKYLARFIITAFPLFFVWFLNGFWHGPTWKYIFYGLYYYILMMLGLLLKPVFDKIIKLLRINIKSWYYKTFQIIRTCIIVCLGLLIFRAESLKQAWVMFTNVFHSSTLNSIVKPGGLNKIELIILFVSVLLIFIVELIEEHNINIREKLDKKIFIVRWIVYLFLIFSTIIFGIYGIGYSDKSFIYGGF